MMFNPNIVEFWHVLMGKKRMSNIRRERKGDPFSGIETHAEQGMFDELQVPDGFKGNYRGTNV